MQYPPRRVGRPSGRLLRKELSITSHIFPVGLQSRVKTASQTLPCPVIRIESRSFEQQAAPSSSAGLSGRSTPDTGRSNRMLTTSPVSVDAALPTFRLKSWLPTPERPVWSKARGEWPLTAQHPDRQVMLRFVRHLPRTSARWDEAPKSAGRCWINREGGNRGILGG